MSTITPHYRTVQQLLQSQSFSIDEYQREYKWESKNIEELLTDLLDKFWNSYKEGHDTSNVSGYEDYFLGSIIVSKRNGKNYLIDGQQRVTSLTLLLIHLYRAAKEQDLPVANSIAPLIFSDSYGRPQFNLDIPERLPVIEALFNGQTFEPSREDESIQNMYSRYRDIEARELAAELEEAFPHFAYWLINKVGLIEIATDNDAYAYAIFETMNDRGKPLSPVDMLKAYLLAPISDANYRAEANRIWRQEIHDLITLHGEVSPERDSEFIKAWFRAQYAQNTRERRAGATDRDWELIGSIFHRWARDNRERLGIGQDAGNRDLIRNHLPFFAQAYKTIQLASSQYTRGLESVFYNAHNEFTWQNTVLLAPLSVTDDEHTLRRKMQATAIYLDIWIMRRVVNYIRVTYSNASYAMYALVQDIRNKPLEELVAILKTRLQQDDIGFDGAPKQKRNGITDLVLNQFSRRYIFHLLARITAFIEKNSGRSDQFEEYIDRDTSNPFDIEHIWANAFEVYQDQYESEGRFYWDRDHVAGLLLLPADVNRSLQDRSYEEKVSIYGSQNLYAASLAEISYQNQPRFRDFRAENDLAFRPYARYGRDEQLERRQLIRDLVHLVWSPSRLDEVLN